MRKQMVVGGILFITFASIALAGCTNWFSRPQGEECESGNPLSCGNNRFCKRTDDSDKGICVDIPKSPAMALKLPFPEGVSMYCAQGNLNPDPDASHSTADNRENCMFAFDFASPANEPPSLVLASLDGVAYVYGGCEVQDILRQNVDGCNDGFGNMVKIDHENGYYSLYAHFAGIAIASGTKVKTGDIIGIEGNTGKAGGKHIHWSLNRGDASKKRVAPSVPITTVYAKDATSGSSSATPMNWREISCGRRSFEGAHRYESNNHASSNINPTYGLPEE